MSDKIKVHLVEDGPIKISNFESIKYCGKKLDKTGDAFLCRCGESENAPFCDGAHAKVGFSGKNEINKPQKIRIWEGKTIRTFFNANICMHAGYCRPLAGLREKEESGDASVAKEIASTVTSCPSGALSYEMIEGPNAVAFNSSAEVEIKEGGEIRVQCEFDGQGVELQEHQPENRLTLCRCGSSQNKPFCDASHNNKEGFK